MANEAAGLFKRVLTAKKRCRIKLLGDSITHGVGGTGFEQNGEKIVAGFARNPDGFCWAKLLKEHLETHYGCEVVNNACTGTDVGFIRYYFDQLVDEEDDLVFCMIGTNNRHQYCKDGPKRSKETHFNEFVAELTQLAESFARAGKDVIFMANIPAAACNEADGSVDIPYWRILHMCDINEAHKKVAAEHGLPLISLYDRISAYCERESVAIDAFLQEDGLHPNDRGYQVMYSLLLEALEI